MFLNAQDALPLPPRLRYAAGYGQLDVVKFLLNRGVAFDAHGGDGKTALFES